MARDDDTTTRTRDSEWPNTFRTREELDELLEEGLKSPVSEKSWREVVDEQLRRLRGG